MPYQSATICVKIVFTNHHLKWPKIRPFLKVHHQNNNENHNLAHQFDSKLDDSQDHVEPSCKVSQAFDFNQSLNLIITKFMFQEVFRPSVVSWVFFTTCKVFLCVNLTWIAHQKFIKLNDNKESCEIHNFFDC